MKKGTAPETVVVLKEKWRGRGLVDEGVCKGGESGKSVVRGDRDGGFDEDREKGEEEEGVPPDRSNHTFDTLGRLAATNMLRGRIPPRPTQIHPERSSCFPLVHSHIQHLIHPKNLPLASL